MNMDNENTLLDQALNAATQQAGLAMRVVEEPEVAKGYDAIIEINGDKNLRYYAEVKKWAQQGNTGLLINAVKALPGKGLLVADYINPKMADRLREQQVQFIDATGNTYINDNNLYVFIKGNKPERVIANAHAEINRAFQTTGLKVVFAFLCNPELVNAPYRQIADQANVALGTVAGVITGLNQAGFIIDRGKRGRRLTNKQKLLERWVEAYPEKLRPKQMLGTYQMNKIIGWQDIELTECNGLWGGEVAAQILTDYLTPQQATIYIPKGELNLLLATAELTKITKKELVPQQATIEVIQNFWHQPYPITEMETEAVHPILIYADLLATGDPRNGEAAKIIYDKKITELIRED